MEVRSVFWIDDVALGPGWRKEKGHGLPRVGVTLFSHKDVHVMRVSMVSVCSHTIPHAYKTDPPWHSKYDTGSWIVLG